MVAGGERGGRGLGARIAGFQKVLERVHVPAVDDHLEQKRMAARFEPTAADTSPLEPLEMPGPSKTGPPPANS